jgi:hypothetical protein
MERALALLRRASRRAAVERIADEEEKAFAGSTC